jgi:hypothetical protein
VSAGLSAGFSGGLVSAGLSVSAGFGFTSVVVVVVVLDVFDGFVVLLELPWQPTASTKLHATSPVRSFFTVVIPFGKMSGVVVPPEPPAAQSV